MPTHVIEVQDRLELIRTSKWPDPTPAQADLPSQQRYLLPFLALLIAYCGWVFSLPLFPTQDDPMHLYYVNVLHHLLSGGHSLFNNFYTVRQPLPPYTIQYVFLLGLTSLLDPVIAEKCMVCIILASTAFGFRFLATALGVNGRVLSLWIFPIALSWPLFMGFHNFCLSLSFVLWALGLWFRAVQSRGYSYRIAFLLAVFIVALTHPVPLIFLLGVIGVDVAGRIWSGKWKAAHSWRVTLLRERLNLISVFVSYMSLSYIALFLNKPVRGNAGSAKYVFPEFLALVNLQHMAFASGGLLTKLYRCGLYLILGVALTLAFRSWKKAWNPKRINGSSVLLLCTLMLMLVLPILPSKMNGLEYFAERLPILAWLFAMAAAASFPMNMRWKQVSVLTAVLFGLFTLGLADRFIRPVAKEISLIDAPHKHGRAGLLFDAPVKIQDANLNFNPYFRWGGVRYFGQSGAVLLDDPWAGPPNILPVDRTSNPEIAVFSQQDLQYPEYLYKRLIDSAETRNALLSKVDFIVFVGKPARGIVDDLLAVDRARNWKCEQSNWYFVCEVAPAIATRPQVTLRPASTFRPAEVEVRKILYRRDPRAKWNDTPGETPFLYTRQN